VEPRKYRLLELATYGYCSMQYHLRFGLKLPWVAASPEVAFAAVTRETVREYFRCLGVRELRQRARKNMEGVLDRGLDLIAKHFRNVAIRRRKFDLILAMRDAESVFHPGRDTPVGFDVKTTVGVPSDETILVEGALDFVMWRHAGTPLETAVGFSFVNLDDPLEDLVNIEPIKGGFGIMAMRSGHGYDVMALHETIPLMRPKKKFGTAKLRTAAFTSFVRAADRGIRNRAFIPQSSPTKCEHCPYRPVCSPSLAEATSLDWKPEAEDPFVSWPEFNR
jgi:hypothetical protein